MISTHPSPPTLPPDAPPLAPLDANTYGAGTIASATSNSTASCNANVDNFAIEFLASLPESNAGGDVDFLGEGGHADETNTTPPPSRVLFNVGLPSGPDDSDDGPERVDAPRGSVFPSTIPMVQNRFFNQNLQSNDDGYDSKGGTPCKRLLARLLARDFS